MLLAATALPSAAAAAERATTDRADELEGPQVHLLYVLPASGTDRNLDADGTIGRSFEVAQGWLQAQTGGRAFRLDAAAEEADVTFLRLPGDDTTRDGVERAAQQAGLLATGKRYLAYVDAAGPGGCSAAPRSGRLAALYLGADPCAATPLRSGTAGAGLWEHTALRSLMRLLGAVPSCAPHHTGDGYVSDAPSDLMYEGPDPWAPSQLDAGRDDYFDHPSDGCLDLADSTFFERRPPGVVVAGIAVTRSGDRVRARLRVRCPERCRVTVSLARKGRRFAATTATLAPGTLRHFVVAGRPRSRGPVRLAVVARDELGKVTRVAVRRRPR